MRYGVFCVEYRFQPLDLPEPSNVERSEITRWMFLIYFDAVANIAANSIAASNFDPCIEPDWSIEM
jgi:hypothetical protein